MSEPNHKPGDTVVIRDDLRVGQQCAMNGTCDRIYEYVQKGQIKYAGKTAVIDRLENFNTFYSLKIDGKSIPFAWTDGMFEDGGYLVLFPDDEYVENHWRKHGIKF